MTGPAPLAGVRVGLDLDGVCCDYVSYLRGFLIDAGWTPASLPEPQDYELSDWFRARADRIAAHTAAVAAGLHRDAAPVAGAISGIRELQTRGAKAVVVSARGSHGERPEQLRHDIDVWARRHDIAFDDVYLGRPKSAAGCDVYIDDSPSDVHDLRTAGQLALIFDQPWNRGVPGPRALGWAALPDQLTNLLKPGSGPS